MLKTITLSVDPTWPGARNDFVLRYDGHLVGRIRLDQTAWQWQVTIPMAMPEWARGAAASLDESKKAFAAAWGRLLKETRPDRLERAWELERAAMARERPMDVAAKDNA
jgi:hypothetical protein